MFLTETNRSELSQIMNPPTNDSVRINEFKGTIQTTVND